MAAPVPIRILYVPVSGAAGSGERRRCEALAMRVAEIDPLAVQAIASPLPAPAPLTTFPLPGSPTRHPDAVIAAIDRFRPDRLVFDGNCRHSVLRHARRAGVGTIFIASRPSSRGRAFGPRRIGLLDAIWLIEAAPNARALSWRESLLRKLHAGLSVRVWSTLHRAPDDPAAERRLATYGWASDGYLLLCAGGGGQTINGRPVNALLLDAARMAAAATGLPALLVGHDDESTGNVRCVRALPQEALLALAGRARACLVGGGSLLPQALSVGACCAAVGWQKEQRARVRKLARAGLVVAADARPPRMARALSAVAIEPDVRERLSVKLQQARIVNGLDEAAQALAARRTGAG